MQPLRLLRDRISIAGAGLEDDSLRPLFGLEALTGGDAIRNMEIEN